MITRKQHWIPRLKLKEWVNDEDYLFIHSYELGDSKIKYNKNKKKFSPDIFFQKDYYEMEGFKINEIEDRLSWLESKYSKIIEKIKNNFHNKKINLNRKELDIIKLFIISSSLRGEVFKERLVELDGDFIFNALNSEKTENERLFDRLSELNNLIKMIQKSHLNKIKKAQEIKIEYMSKLNPLENIMGGLWFKFSSTTLKIFRSKDSEFVLTDNPSSMIMNPITKITELIEFSTVTNKISFGLLTSSAITRDYYKKTNIDLKNDEQGWQVANESLQIKISKFKDINHDVHYKKIGKMSWEDKFSYPWSSLDKHETGVVNAFMINQSSKFVIYTKEREIIEYAFELEKKYNIYRSEEMFK